MRAGGVHVAGRLYIAGCAAAIRLPVIAGEVPAR
jgi:hypothetical protein